MLFSSSIFLFIFLPAVLIGYYLLYSFNSLRNYFLLAASLAFYAWGEPVYVFLMLLSIAANYIFGILIPRFNRNCKKIILTLAILFNLGILFYFKYFNFVLDNINSLFGCSLSFRNISLPIGISFFTFQALSYVIDVYRGTVKAQRNPLYLGLYISFFPQLIAGPIVRYNSIEQQIENRWVDWDKFQTGVFRFIQGFSKKIIIANMLSLASEKAFSLGSQSSLSVMMAWLGSLAYTFQIFFDFSGYSDMAIGLGSMFGFDFEENFNYPYMSKSVSEFWNRWHISLGHWFRDYIYFPLGGSRVDKLRLVRNLFVVWLLTGIWHGAAWQFILWGVIYGIIISFEKLTGIPKKLRSTPLIIAYAVCTFLIVNANWVLFGAQDLNSALYQLGAMVGVGSAGFFDQNALFVVTEYWPYYLIAAVLSTPVLKKYHMKTDQGALHSVGSAIIYITLLIISVSYLAMGAHNPFIYFNF